MKIPRNLTIKINNNKCQLICHPGLIHTIREEKNFLKFRSPGAFFSPAFRSRAWDGHIRFVTEGGQFDTGFLPKVLKYLADNKYKVEFDDFRENFDFDNLPKKLDKYTLRDYQGDAVGSVLHNKLGDLPFPRGIIGAATNAGKTIIAAAIHKAYGKKTLFLINSKDLFEQALQEIPLFLPGKVGQISANKIEWNDFMVCMVQTMKRRIPQIDKKLMGYSVCLVDECDLSVNKTYQSVLKYIYNCYVRVGLSGSPFVHKDKTKNEKLRGLYGEILYTIKSSELVKEGHSSDIKVRILKGNTQIVCKGNYEKEYRLGIIKSKERNNQIRKRVKHHYKYKRFPIIIFCQKHDHVKTLYQKLKPHFDKIEWVHHERKERTQIVNDFRDGKIEVLVSSMILKRGMNFPLIKYICNAGGGDSMSNILQILGRGNRKHVSKKKVVLEDFFDEGAYIKRHSKHRIKLYKSEGYEVIEKYK